MIKFIKKLFGKKQEAVIEVAPLPRLEKRDVERLFARVFLSEDGQKVLSYLQATTFQRTLLTDASDAQLRQMEGQRTLLSTIQRLALGGMRT